ARRPRRPRGGVASQGPARHAGRRFGRYPRRLSRLGGQVTLMASGSQGTMLNPDLTHLLGVLAVMLAGAKTLALAAPALGWPPSLGDVLAGLLLGRSVFGLVNPDDMGLRAIAEIGLVLFVFQVGLGLDYRQFLAASRPAAVVAIAGVFLTFTL